MLPKIVAIVGSTGAGKSALGVLLAKKNNGEIVSADSRQVYKGLDIGTAKPRGHWEMVEGHIRFVSEGIVHHLVDYLDPKEEFTLKDFKRSAEEAISDILARGKLPIVVGGTAQYIYALLQNWQIPEVSPNPALRARLKKLSVDELDAKLKEVDPEEAERMDMNPRRIIRALEIFEETHTKPSTLKTKGGPLYKPLTIGIFTPEDYEHIVENRVEEMLNNGLEKEVLQLAKHYSWDLPALQTIGYQEFRKYLKGNETLEQVKNNLVTSTLQFSKRQMTWFKRDKEIHWVHSPKEAEELVESNI